MHQEPDHYKMTFHVKGKDHVLHLRRQRFEKTVDSIDKMIHGGKHDIAAIKAKHAAHIVDVKEPKNPASPALAKVKAAAKIVRQRGPAAEGEFDKKAHVAKHMEDNREGASISHIAKMAAASSNGKLTYANAYYLASKHKK